MPPGRGSRIEEDGPERRHGQFRVGFRVVIENIGKVTQVRSWRSDDGS